MAHRGRLNVLANVMGKPFRAIFHEFSGGSSSPEDVGGSGDVKYHLGTSTDREIGGISVHMSLLPNPSHLEAVNLVVLGKVRATQTARHDADREQGLPVLLHGDRSEEHTPELHSPMTISYAVFCLTKTTRPNRQSTH